MDMNKYNEWPANHKGDKNPSPKIIALGKRITDVAGHMIGGVTAEDPEYWGLAEIITEEMAEVGLTMKRRAHYTFDQLCEMNKDKVAEKGKEGFQKLLDEMSYIGLLEYDYGYHYDHNGRTAPQSERRYTLPMFVPGSAELFNMEEIPGDVKGNPRLEQHPDVASFFERMTYIPLEGITQMVPPGGAGVGMHVIPVEKAISMENEAIDIEKLSYWLSKYEGKIGVGRCSCRASRKVIGEGVADDDYGWCIGVGDFADYCRETGKGHDITKEEALEILQRAEDNGFVHQITNIDGENKIFGICNCNVNICNALRTSQLFNTPNMSRSAYVAHVDKEKCVACGRCVEYCPAGATRLGQKLCKADGTEVTYPKQLLPDKVKWGKEYYDPDYRDNNRINSHKTGTAPCKTACPAHIAVQGYLKKAAQGEYTEALALIKKQNPFPAVCGRICNRRCEDACTRGTIDEPIAIDAVKRFIAERDLHADTRYVPPIVVPASIHKNGWEEKIAIIGGGPALVADGLTYQVQGAPDLFIGGDVMTGPKFAIDAIAAGHWASESLHRYVQNGHMTIGRNKWEFIELNKDDILVESYDNSSRQSEGFNETLGNKSFKDAHIALTEEQVKIETSRCLGCGATIVDANKCIGCGVCTTKCAFDAITLHRDHPECSTMIPAEDKFKAIVPYELKRAVKIVFAPKTAEEKAAIKAHKEAMQDK